MKFNFLYIIFQAFVKVNGALAPRYSFCPYLRWGPGVGEVRAGSIGWDIP